MIEVSENYFKRYQDAATKFNENDLIAILKIISDTTLAVKTSQQPHLKFELGLIKIVKLPSTKDIESLLENLDLLKKKAKNNSVNESSTINYGSVETSRPSVGVSLTLDVIKENWPAVISGIHDSKPSLATSLDGSVPINFYDNQLEIEVTQINAFQKDLINNNFRLIEDALESVFQDKIKSKFKFQIVQEIQQKNDQEHLSKEDKDELLQKIRSEDKDIARLIDEFDLELF